MENAMASSTSTKQEDKVVLSYHDSLLRESDVALLRGPYWLNDKIIGFYFEYLEYEVFSDCHDKVCFITPDVTQFIKLYTGPELSLFLDPLKLSEKSLVLLAVNNNASSEFSGGTHWSLLVYARKENTFYSLDSCHSINLLPSQQCAQKLTPFLNVPSAPNFSEISDCPQQANGYDCGVFVLLFAESMCSTYLKESTCNFQTTLASTNNKKCVEFRKICLELINKLEHFS